MHVCGFSHELSEFQRSAGLLMEEPSLCSRALVISELLGIYATSAKTNQACKHARREEEPHVKRS